MRRLQRDVDTDHSRARKHVLETGQCACGLNQRLAKAGGSRLNCTHFTLIGLVHKYAIGQRIWRDVHSTPTASLTAYSMYCISLAGNVKHSR